MDAKQGYHVLKIARGEYGKTSKIYEEVMEMIDAEAQGNPIMTLVELSDIVGAMKGYLEANFPNIKFEDVVNMADTTNRAFASGDRRAKTN